MGKTIELTGIGMSRSVIMHGGMTTSVDWGYVGAKTEKLAKLIVKHEKLAVSDEVELECIRVMTREIVTLLGKDNFRVRFEVDRWIADFLSGNIKAGQDYLEFQHGKLPYLSQYVNFPSLNIGSATFANGTVEYCILKMMPNIVRDNYINYLKFKTKVTKRMEEVSYMRCEYNEMDDVFEITGGLGSMKNWKGTPI